MRNKISAIIVDADYQKHDYSQVKTDSTNDYAEKYFELKILETTSGIIHEIYKFRGVDAIITIGDESIWGDLAYLPYSIRKKWTHINTFDPKQVVSNIINTFLGNIERHDAPLQFSFFTCTYNTDEHKLNRLYSSLCNQTYKEWDWFIIDDSPNEDTVNLIESLEDPRITVIKNHSIHGNIGFNKHTVAMMCDGDFLCEVDHDDELTPDCLETIKAAYETYPDSDFIYSCALELKMPGREPIIYGDGWGWGEGLTKTDIVNGEEFTFSESPGVNPFSIRTIYSQPNHIRCWKKSFYHALGGHNSDLAVLDDQELIIRTFLSGKMTKIDKALYIQYEGEGERGVSKENTQSIRFSEIQRTTMLLKNRFDKLIHQRILELGYDDYAWDKQYDSSILWRTHKPGLNIMSHLYKP